MCVPVAVWQPCELLYTCYLLTYFELLHLCYYAVRRGNDHIRFRSVGRRNSVIAKFHYTDTDTDTDPTRTKSAHVVGY